MSTLAALLQAMRLKQWSKNFFVFAGLIFSGQIANRDAAIISVEAFICFCLVSSSIYLINDVADIKRDRQHPKKRNRPIASGRLPVSTAVAAFIALAIIGSGFSFYIEPGFGFICFGYWLLMVFYTFVLKHEVILDVFVIAAGFVLRALGGAVAISVPISSWLIVCTSLLSLFLALCKRRAEITSLDNGGADHREALKEYSEEYIDQMISVVTSATVVSYTFYAFQSDTAKDQHSLILTVPFVLYGIFRYLYLVYKKDQGGSPEQMILEDKPLFFNMLLWAALSALLLWRP